MAARHVRPLDPEAWGSFVEALRRGPSEEQVRAIERAMGITRHLAEPGGEDYEEPAGAPPACPPDSRRGEEAAGGMLGMAARHVRPLDPEAWGSFVEALRRGPSEEQVRAIERAMDITRHLAEPGDEDYEG